VGLELPLSYAPGIAAEIPEARRWAGRGIGAESPAGFFIGKAGKKSMGALKKNNRTPKMPRSLTGGGIKW
jgi:hypothetical protein